MPSDWEMPRAASAVCSGATVRLYTLERLGERRSYNLPSHGEEVYQRIIQLGLRLLSIRAKSRGKRD